MGKSCYWRTLVAALALFWATRTACTAVDCPSGSTERGGQCTIEREELDATVSSTRIDSLDPEAGINPRDAELALGGAGASGAAANGGAGATGSAAAGSGGNTAGSFGNTAGTAVSSADPCSSEGATRCSALGEGKREQCKDGGWMPAEACSDGQTCVVEASGRGVCVKRAEVCRGNGGKAVCDAQGSLMICNADESLESQTMCQSPRLCQAGVAARACAMCLPNEEHRCTGKTLERCAADGMSFAKAMECETAALCNKTAGLCTSSACAPDKTSCDGALLQVCNADGTAFKSTLTCGTGTTCDATGGDCNTCEPGSTKCEGDMVATCDATGQSYTASACPAGSHCVGLGQCVECASNADCAGLTKDCKIGVCSKNTCSAQNQPGGTSCAAAGGKPGACVLGACQCTPQCDGKMCGADGCGGTCPPGCAGGLMCAGDRCVDCQSDDQCSNLNGAQGCIEGYCEAGTCRVRNAPATKSCGSSGTCRAGSCCTPDCKNKCGGADDGCGGTCTGKCSGGATCKDGTCCTTKCSGKCGGESDGCGGFCPNPCSNGESCSAGKCCAPSCANKCGGADDGCGGKCNAPCPCTPSCSGKCAGESDGCNGTCRNPCKAGESCSAGKCCAPSCTNKCGGADDGCGGKCDAPCPCTPNCSGKCAGESDGCPGGMCPNPCKGDDTCAAGMCTPKACVPSCGMRCEGDNGCPGGKCDASNCAKGLVCQAGMCVMPAPVVRKEYESCDPTKPCDTGLVCKPLGPAGQFCVTAAVYRMCTAPRVLYQQELCVHPCPSADDKQTSTACPTAASTCYVESGATSGYCAPSAS
ncbi:MAG TPA: hypothetical protein VJR89_15100 [Polyangiales bacterium]|nr:hypothetical protein [Polyangiales bacterium]